MNKFQGCAMYFSLQEREKRIMLKYKKEFEIIKKLSFEELKSLSIEYKTRYERKKNMFSFFTITLVISIITAICTFF